MRVICVASQDRSPEAEYELRLLELMRAPLLRAPVRGTAVVAGPSGLVQEAVDRAAARAPTLEDLAAECRAVVLFNFDPDADPLGHHVGHWGTPLVE